jgi:hypothetical protein
MCKRSTSAPTTRWRSKCALPTILFASKLSWRRRRHNESRRLDLDLVARKREVLHRKDGDHSARTGIQGSVATDPAGIWGSAAAGDRHRSFHG